MSLDLPDWTRRVQSPPVEPIAAFGVDVHDNDATTTTMIVGIAGKRIELVELGAVFASSAGSLAIVEDANPRGVMFVSWHTGSGPTLVTYMVAAVSPEAPAVYPPVPPGAIIVPAATDLLVSVVSATPGAGHQTVEVIAMYRLV